jgi:hypothetical protein
MKKPVGDLRRWLVHEIKDQTENGFPVECKRWPLLRPEGRKKKFRSYRVIKQGYRKVFPGAGNR